MKRLPLLFVSLFMALAMNAEPITQQQALQKAQQFMPHKTFGTQQMARKVLGKTASTTTQSLYVFNIEGNGGFVVVSGDDSTEPILGYTTKGHYDEENMPSNFRFWMEQRAAEIEAYQRYAASKPSTARSGTARKIIAHAAVEPLIITTWNQGNARNETNTDGVYNIHLPMINGQYPCTGCVATAAAQIMYYYQWPQDFTTSVPGYTDPQSLADTSEGLEPIQFQWNKMKTSYVFNDPDTEAVNAVADLMLYCGYAAQMTYGVEGSGAYSNTLAEGMAEYFGYDPNSWKYLARRDYSISDWDQLVYNELANGRPVIYDGSFTGGHAFICDGYDGAGMYHFNWGWGGWANGYFKLQATNPDGIENISSMGYIADQYCLIGLQPNSWPEIVDTNADDTWEVPVIEGIVTTAENVAIEGTTVKMDLFNFNDDDYNFGFGIGLLNSDGTITPLDTRYKNYQTVTLPSGYGFTGVPFDFSAYSLADGTYTLVPICLLNGETEWKRCSPGDLFFELKISGELREISVHPVENLIINDFGLAAGGLPDTYQYVKVNVTNAGDNLKTSLYVFLGTNEDKGEFRNWKNISIAAGNTKEQRIYIGKLSEGSYTLWLTSDYAGTKVLAKKEITITQDVRATHFEVIGEKEPNNILQVDVTVENHAGDYNLPLYLFASTTEEKEFVYAAGSAIESGSEETVTFYFQPDQSGIWNLWVTTDQNGNNIIGQTTIELKGKYKLIYQVDGNEYKTYEVEYGASVTPEEEPTKEGYTFSGWSEIPETMPAHDVTVTGTFTINKYKLIYLVDGNEYKTYEIEYGASLTPEEEPTKEGYTFSGWSELPEIMPANDVTVTGTFSVNSYALTYMVDGEVYKTYSVAYGTAITPEEEPAMEGYTFSGWSEIPETMPAHDVTVTGTFSVNSYMLTYMVDGEVYKTYSVAYGTKITPEAEPEKEGYTFSGWSEIPETMPAKDVTVNGTFTINSYTLTYKVDGEEYKSFTVKYRDPITPLEAPTKEGYTFSGWDGLPRSMPAQDVTVTGTFTINSYTITYVLDGETYATETLEYEAEIVPPVIPGLEDYTIWEDVPKTMPGSDITIYGKAKEIIDRIISIDNGQLIIDNSTGVYDISGRKMINVRKKGINIIRYSDGTSRKVLIK